MANKLELTWVGKDKEIKIEPRILIENPALSNTAQDINTENMLIHGDNLLALKALESKFYGQVKCIYIDPPYNTQKAFSHYNDNLEHSIWLNLMRERLRILQHLLADDGCIFIQINDDEAAYLKVLCDEVFERKNYETTFYVKVRHENRILRQDTKYQLVIEQVLMYRKTDKFISPRRENSKDSVNDYKYNVTITGAPKSIQHIGIYDVEIYSPTEYIIERVAEGTGNFKEYQIRGSLITQKGSASEYYEQYLRARRNVDGLGALYRVIGMGINGDGLGYRYIIQPTKSSSKNGFYYQGKPKKTTVNKGLPYPNFYDKTDAFNNVGYEGVGYFNGGKKPEAWINFLLDLANVKEHDIVLDSFLGSGTTAAVAHKKGLHYIGIEMGEHAYTLCKPRLDNVINADKTGISKSVNWQGGGGYKFYELAPTLILQDDFGQEVINPEYNAEMLASAVALHEGYTYAPDESCYFKQAHSGNNAYLYVTTRHIDKSAVNSILTQLQDNEYLIIVCKSFDSNAAEDAKNITLKKIPQSLLDNCEFGKDDYKLNIVNPPVYEDEETEDNE